MTEILNISYCLSPKHNIYLQFDIYVPPVSASPPPPLVCFVHGGAWRAEDKADHAALARNLCARTACVVAVPNYRLTPQQSTAAAPADVFRHPGHAQDILTFLSFVIDWPGVPGLGRPFDATRLFLIGHSCSAHMLASIFLDSSASTPSLTPSPALLLAVKALIFSEGIYDIDLLLTSFPAYREWFIANTFGDQSSYKAFSTNYLPLRTQSPRWHIIHSRGDTLVDLAQAEAMFSHLSTLIKDPYKVTRDFDSIDEEHNDMLKGQNYIRVIGDYIIKYL